MDMERKTLTYIPYKRHYVFCVDEAGLAEVANVMMHVQSDQVTYELFQVAGVKDFTEWQTELEEGLLKQKMGTYLYVAASWDKLNVIKRIASEVGFSEEEAQYHGIGEQEKVVFCGRCHGITSVKDNLFNIECPKCGIPLTISDHFSRKKEAYLGYTDFQ
ncbi:putative paraquat-inducible protein A [Bacillus tianshenii]|uniref:Paraquat-inducible protein A n=1 Tax=Sutcliffiella tianshenii TaxID=1463404 RepID=A0ABS2NVS1_9BACI|nr:dimethylamine monooxygenase subunit DmmA family protein [Bacillus tianshenii]MBM7618760.1 putative paraquat-inducible protein A [Bacillus tianshenii]